MQWEYRSEENGDNRNRCDDWNDRVETWEENELTDDHKKLEYQNWALRN